MIKLNGTTGKTTPRDTPEGGTPRDEVLLMFNMPEIWSRPRQEAAAIAQARARGFEPPFKFSFQTGPNVHDADPIFIGTEQRLTKLMREIAKEGRRIDDRD